MPKSSGFTLIELVVSIALLAIVMTGAVSLFGAMSTNQARNIATYQSVHIADYFLSEAMGMAYAGQTAQQRHQFSVVDDYHQLSDNGCHNAGTPNGVCDRQGIAVPAWSGYQVAMTVTGEEVGEQEMKKIAVTVTSPLGDTVLLSAYKGAL